MPGVVAQLQPDGTPGRGDRDDLTDPHPEDPYVGALVERDRARELGADVRFGVTIEGLETAGGEITGVRTDQGVLTADRYVLALGSYSTRMLAP